LKRFSVLVTFLVVAAAYAQTPPIQPNTPDVKIPGQLNFPAPSDLAIGKQPLTADEAVAIALKRQPAIGIAQGNLLSAQGRTEQAASDLLPSVTAAGSYSRSTIFKGSSSGSLQSGGSFTSSVTADQLLFDFGRTRDLVRQAQTSESAFNQTLSRTQQTVALAVRQAFYNYRQAIADEANTVANVANRQRQLNEAQARLNSGLGEPGDLVSAKASLASASVSLLTARDSTITSRILLAQLIGVDPRTPITPASSSEAKLSEESDLQQLVIEALNSRPDIKAAKADVASAKYGVSYAQKGNLPRFSLSAGAGARGTNDPLQTEDGVLSLNVSWDFMDSGFTAGQVKAARGSEVVAEQTLIQVSQQAVADVGQAYLDVQSAVQRVDLANVEVANALEYVRIAEGRYTGGIGLFSDVTTAQTSLVSAQHDQTQAVADVERARARLRTAIGRL